ncbi:MAG: 50S ribosomal protein L14e [Candidatus Aenigmatarchaeota archaeon]
MFDVGRICMKIAGREAGKYCVVIKKLDSNFVLVTGPKSVTNVKRRKCNILHLEPLSETIKIKEDASDDEVISAYEEASIFAKLNLQKPKGTYKPKEEKAEKPEEKPKRKSAKKKEG